MDTVCFAIKGCKKMEFYCCLCKKNFIKNWNKLINNDRMPACPMCGLTIPVFDKNKYNRIFISRKDKVIR